MRRRVKVLMQRYYGLLDDIYTWCIVTVPLRSAEPFATAPVSALSAVRRNVILPRCFQARIHLQALPMLS